MYNTFQKGGPMAGGTKYTTNRTRHLDKSPLLNWAIDCHGMSFRPPSRNPETVFVKTNPFPSLKSRCSLRQEMQNKANRQAQPVVPAPEPGSSLCKTKPIIRVFNRKSTIVNKTKPIQERGGVPSLPKGESRPIWNCQNKPKMWVKPPCFIILKWQNEPKS
jgi:hypothetical protein